MGGCANLENWAACRSLFPRYFTTVARPFHRHPGPEPGPNRRASARRENTLRVAHVSRVIAPPTRRCWIPVTSTGMTVRWGRPWRKRGQEGGRCGREAGGSALWERRQEWRSEWRGRTEEYALPHLRHPGPEPGSSRRASARREGALRMAHVSRVIAPRTRRCWIPVTSTGMTGRWGALRERRQE